MIETSQLQTLVAVAKVNSFSKAAERLGVTQSAISQSMKGLEKKVGVPLVRRVGKTIALTPEGDKLNLLAKSFLEKLETTVDELTHDISTMSGKVRVGTLNGVGKSWLAPHLLEYSKSNPNLDVEISLGFPHDLVKSFDERLLDFLILPEGVVPETGKKVFLSEERSTLVFPKDSSFKLDKNITLEEIAELPTILFEKDDHLYLKWCKSRFDKKPEKINVRYTVNSHGNMLQAVSQGLGVAVIPTHVLGRSFYRYEIQTLGKDFEVSNYKFFLAYHEDQMNMVRMQETLAMLTKDKSPLDIQLED